MKAIRHTHFVVALALTCLLGPAELLGQEPEAAPTVVVGSRVRVTSPLLDTRLVGSVVAIDDTQLLVRPSNTSKWGVEPLLVQRDQLTALEVSRGKKSKWLTGGMIAAGVGGASGALLAGALCSHADFDCDVSPASAATVGALFGVAVGFAAGAGVGALIKTDRWEEARLPEVEPMVSVLPGRDHSAALTIGLRLRI